MKRILIFIWHIPRNIFVGFLWFYQKTFSPDHSFWARAIHVNGYCKFYPTCSEYAKQALKRYGLIRGFLKGGYRVLRCNPWSDGGIDKP